MMQLSDKRQAELCEMTSIPTASACEGQVIQWVERWAERRKGVTLRRDRFGNVLLESSQSPRGRSPLVIEAHMDHPAFVVREVESKGRLTADFRGGVAEAYFNGSRVRLWDGAKAVQTGKVTRVVQPKSQRDKQATIQLDRAAEAKPGQKLTWALPASRVTGDRLRAPVCDNLVSVCAALHAFDQIRRPGKSKQNPRQTDVRVLLTLCEEVGLIGAMAACQSALVPKGSRIVVLENSKSFADSPIGGGPIVRTGDGTSTFDPELTYAVGAIASDLAGRDRTFGYQRRLMTGGTCEATAFQAFGYTSTCLCLPLGNYHNMNEKTGRIDSETISIRDYAALVRLLSEVGKRIDDRGKTRSLHARLSTLFEARKNLLETKPS